MPWVRLDDQRYVQNPVFYGKEWFLSCTDEPTLVVHIYREPKEENLLRRMRKILRDAGISAKIVKEVSHRDVFAFPPNFKGLKQSASVRLELEPLPVPALLDCHANVWAAMKPEGEVFNECIKDSETNGSSD